MQPDGNLNIHQKKRLLVILIFITNFSDLLPKNGGHPNIKILSQSLD